MMTASRNTFTRTLSALTGLLGSTSIAWAQNSKRLGLSPEDQRRFDDNVAAGDFYFYLALAAIVAGFVLLLVGVAYHLAKKKRARS